MNKSFLVAMLLMLTPLSQAAETLYVQSVQAKLLAEPTFNAKTVVVAPKGSRLTAQAGQEGWYQVSFNGQRGYVSSLMVAQHPPHEPVSFFQSLTNFISGNEARTRASRVTMVGAVRGLAADDRSRLSREAVADYAALEKMNAMQMEEREVMDFLQKGLGHDG